MRSSAACLQQKKTDPRLVRNTGVQDKTKCSLFEQDVHKKEITHLQEMRELNYEQI